MDFFVLSVLTLVLDFSVKLAGFLTFAIGSSSFSGTIGHLAISSSVFESESSWVSLVMT